MRATNEWCDVTICNISSRGLMAKSNAPPPKGAYIELRHRSVGIIGRVVWSHGARFGVRTQDRIEISALLAEASFKPKTTGEERRLAPRDRRPGVRQPDAAARAEASRRFARTFDRAALLLVALVAAVVIFDVASGSLSKPLEETRDALAGGQHDRT
jgi:hypothetical protein